MWFWTFLSITIVWPCIFGWSFAISDDDADTCNCEHCDEEKVIGLGEETTTLAWQQVPYEEDSDDDGNRTICARNRDFNERTFPSVCHMLCYNRCTTYRTATRVEEKGEMKYVAVAYRPNYYKLKDGAC